MEIRKQYDQVGKDYIKTMRTISGVKQKVSREFILRNLPNLGGKKILDLGCGAGDDIEQYEKMDCEGVYGLDSSELMVDEAKKTIKNPEKILWGDIESVPFEDKFFDIVICRHSLHYLASFETAYKEIARILNDNGIVIITVPHPVMELFLRKSKNYNKDEVIEFYAHKKFILNFPSHRLSHYFSSEFLKLFELDELYEHAKKEDFIKDFEAPVVLAFKAHKK